MENKKINQICELPEWFNIRNYEPVKYYDTTSWYSAVFIRQFAFYEHTFTEYSMMCGKKVLKDGVRMAMKNKNLAIDSTFNEEPVTSMKPKLMKEYKENHPNDKFTDFLRIDLTAPNSALETNFKLWLKEKRKKIDSYPYKKFFSESDFSSWHKYGVLPYMDLKYWSEITKTKIAQHTIGKAIIDINLDLDSTEAVRKTTHKYAELLKKSSTLRKLRYQSYFETKSER